MKKSLRKPENWQDFESLCKKLWGEIWHIEDRIKKNGRLGQKQAGVDIYGIPSGKDKYWGIQCKGKDDYLNSKITITEIKNEILKAKDFSPLLEVYIIATTSNKDSNIEEFIRQESLKNKKQGMFEILLFCWEDIVDLIEDSPNTLNWYLNESNYKGNFDFKISFNNFQEKIILEPIFAKHITKYKLTQKTDFDLLKENLTNNIYSQFSLRDLFNKINKSWCEFEIILENTGQIVIEDWRLDIKFTKGIREIYDEEFPSLKSNTIIYNNDKTISYIPSNNQPLIQKDNRSFKIDILINHEAKNIEAEWSLLARDFNKSGKFKIDVIPKYIETIKYEEVNKPYNILDDEIIIHDYITD
ncbi:hypothetical protein [Flavobacterium beibuense]|uniref:restriction endonuclease n=1 Tax=Flavobacterium beibuense TaxID=657326 RepID=UPI003A92BC9D